MPSSATSGCSTALRAGECSATGQMFAPIGQAVIGGLTTSTILTLGLTPTLYAWFDDMGAWLRAMGRRVVEVASGAGEGAEEAAAVVRRGMSGG